MTDHPQEEWPEDEQQGLVRSHADGQAERVKKDGTVEPYELEPEPASAPVGLMSASSSEWVSTNVPSPPRWSPQQAVAWARDEVHHPDRSYLGYCLGFVAKCYGWGGSGNYNAITFWNTSRYRRPLSRSFPYGALLFWEGGSAGHGHVALAVGPEHVLIASNDIVRSGRIDIVQYRMIESHWGQLYKGWTLPNFPTAWGVNPATPPEVGSNWDSGEVYVVKLRRHQRESNSVRRLQYRLIAHKSTPTDDLKITGNYNAATEAAVQHWQRHAGKQADGPSDGTQLSNKQARRLFGRNYTVIDE